MNIKPTQYDVSLTINGIHVTSVLIGRHYLQKHGSYMNDALILELVGTLNGLSFQKDSTTDGVDYYVVDIEMPPDLKIYRLIWFFEGAHLQVLGVVNAYRRKN